ncbi:hypothetical protein B296_00045401 [Ensete ventricosum]|uniref:Uncharacterized protein n=1 Tax=Ensete ventricosum TaxID=4639 RepID=A0A426XPT7_ENSVE|nr:hypothetical protein B296_00045401 [Ensete ventricosum]
MTQILTRCQGDCYVVNRDEGLTAVDFGGGDVATAGVIGRSEGQREKRYGQMYSSLSKADSAARSPATTSSTLLQPQLHSSCRRPSYSSHFLPCILLYCRRQRLILLLPYLLVAPLSLVPVTSPLPRAPVKRSLPSLYGNHHSQNVASALPVESTSKGHYPSSLAPSICYVPSPPSSVLLLLPNCLYHRRCPLATSQATPTAPLLLHIAADSMESSGLRPPARRRSVPLWQQPPTAALAFDLHISLLPPLSYGLAAQVAVAVAILLFPLPHLICTTQLVVSASTNNYIDLLCRGLPFLIKDGRHFLPTQPQLLPQAIRDQLDFWLLAVVHPWPRHLYSHTGSAAALILLWGALAARPSPAYDRVALPRGLFWLLRMS